ncbi:MmgE/PrpD family protein [Lysinibacillus sp. BW-2-10]|uniref:MmgE/PrpD family protein n=1 Tax=Lysinibacillus sp. BW-2-10 TaxID=2590030 RepID=UPI00117EBB63|nr:MmgE/PrpD family protein [Lysinibacillus sp. BW-2-10]TSI09311.1 MmgE/PrpD family protein [Lysinibacillus sp. BW-2-10]
MSNILMEKMTQFINNTQYNDLPVELVQIAKLAIIDTIGVSLAGWKESAVEIVKRVYLSETNDSTSASLWGEPLKTNIENAAIINGTASHVLDFDDAAPSVIIHPSAPILSGIIPLAEKLGSSGEDVITAYAIGTEVMLRLGQLVDLKHYQLGWHTTATLGTIGVAAACSFLYNLTKEESSNAIAIAASMSGGLQKNFGTMTKSFHVGIAASQGIQAANLAKNGFTGSSDIFGTKGFLYAFTGGENVEHIHSLIENMEFGKPYDLVETGLSVKKFPCCYATHRLIHGVLTIKEEVRITLNDVEEISILVPPGQLMPLVHSRPVTGLQGKFSAEYTALAALRDGYIKLSSFEDEQVLDLDIQNMLPFVKVKELEGTTKTSQEIEEMPVQVTITIKDGTRLEKQIMHAPGSKATPLSDQEQRGKWIDCLNHYAKMLNISDDQLLEKANMQYNNGLKIESYKHFSDWLSEIHQYALLAEKV